MNKSNLVKNISDQIIEAQLKLGYVKESIRLYYPIESLNALLETNYSSVEELVQVLNSMFEKENIILCEDGRLKTDTVPQYATEERLKGFCGVSFNSHAGRIEVNVSADGAEYIHKYVKTPEFLKDIIELFTANHSLKLDEIKELYSKYSSDYECEEMPQGSDFDYVLFFNDKTIDEYYYCIKIEMGHTIYHRFTESDYKMLI